MLRKILFVDAVCPKPYDPGSLGAAMGGTEATVIRVAEELAKTQMVAVLQHNRTSESVYNAAYWPLTAAAINTFNPDVVVVLRAPSVALEMRKLIKNTDKRVFLWMHDLVSTEFLKYAKDIGEAGIGIIAVSAFHRTHLINIMKIDNDIKRFPIVATIFNPISDELEPHPDFPHDNNKLVFFSSPHKGLARTIELFKCARNFNPGYELFVANPGYYKDTSEVAEGMTNLGSLAFYEVLYHVRSALCVFYPNTVAPETFGLVFAEANAVGTPVLAHPFGAAPEVLTNPEAQLVDCRSNTAVLDRLESWRHGNRPEVSANPKFRLAEVIKRWNILLNYENYGRNKDERILQ